MNFSNHLTKFLAFLFECEYLVIYYMHTSGISDGQRFYPSSPLRDYANTPGRRRRSKSASVRFKNTSPSGEDVRTNHRATCYCHVVS